MPNPQQQTLSLLIVDDHAVVRAGLEAMFRGDPGFEVVVVAANSAEVLAACDSSFPDLVLLGLHMPNFEEFFILRELHKRWPDLQIIVISSSNNDAEVRLARREGAMGFLGKFADRSTLVATIQKVAMGKSAFPQKNEANDKCDSLTARELEIFQYLGRGLTRIEIGRALGISGQTVKSHLKRIFYKLKVTDQAEAVVRGFELGLLF